VFKDAIEKGHRDEDFFRAGELAAAQLTRTVGAAGEL
jgi:hypothetical protein